jgi:hypothetical protein
MLAALVGFLSMLGLRCRGHRAVVLENVALRQQLSVFRRTVRRPHLRTSDRLFWVLLAKTWQDWRTASTRSAPTSCAHHSARQRCVGHKDLLHDRP